MAKKTDNWDQVQLDPQKAQDFAAGERGAADPALHYQGDSAFPGGGILWDSGGGSGGGDSKGPNLNLDILLNRTYQGLPPQGVEALKQALKAQGVDDTSSFADFQKALGAVQQAYPQLQQYTPMGRAFPPTTPGQLTPEQSKAMWDTASKYEQPYLDAMQNTSNQMGAYLKQLMPSLPKGYQSLVKAQMDGPGGLLNLPSQVSNLIHEQNPAAIANAYSQYYGSGGTTPTATLSGLLGGAKVGST